MFALIFRGCKNTEFYYNLYHLSNNAVGKPTHPRVHSSRRTLFPALTECGLDIAVFIPAFGLQRGIELAATHLG
jgi:hypothetical protein